MSSDSATVRSSRVSSEARLASAKCDSNSPAAVEQQARRRQEGASALRVAVEVVDAEGDRPAGAEVVAPPDLGDAGPEQRAQVPRAGHDVVVPHRLAAARRAPEPLQRLCGDLYARVEEQDEVGGRSLEPSPAGGEPAGVDLVHDPHVGSLADLGQHRQALRVGGPVVDDHDLEGPVRASGARPRSRRARVGPTSPRCRLASPRRAARAPPVRRPLRWAVAGCPARWWTTLSSARLIACRRYCNAETIPDTPASTGEAT